MSRAGLPADRDAEQLGTQSTLTGWKGRTILGHSPPALERHGTGPPQHSLSLPPVLWVSLLPPIGLSLSAHATPLSAPFTISLFLSLSPSISPPSRRSCVSSLAQAGPVSPCFGWQCCKVTVGFLHSKSSRVHWKPESVQAFNSFHWHISPWVRMWWLILRMRFAGGNAQTCLVFVRKIKTRVKWWLGQTNHQCRQNQSGLREKVCLLLVFFLKRPRHQIREDWFSEIKRF